MMTLFLTSSFCIREEERIDPTAGFLEELKKRLPREMTGVFICSNPGTHEITDLYGRSTADCFRKEGQVEKMLRPWHLFFLRQRRQ